MSRERLEGFTLVELLIALVLTGLIMLALFSGLRISTRAWDAADQRQQAIAEQYQLQQLLRRLIGQARSHRVRVSDGGVQVAFRGESDQLVFVAPRYAASSGSALLWYRLRLSPATAERPQALVLETRAFDQDWTADWRLLFDPGYTADENGKALLPPEEHVLRFTGDAHLSFSYLYSEPGQLAQTQDEWVEEGQLPRMVELSLEEFADPNERWMETVPKPAELLPQAWGAVAIALQEYSYDVRSDGI